VTPLQTRRRGHESEVDMLKAVRQLLVTTAVFFPCNRTSTVEMGPNDALEIRRGASRADELDGGPH